MGRWRGVELADLELSGERLVLRRWRAEDAARVLEALQDQAMGRYLSRLPQPYTGEDARGFVELRGHEGRDDGTGLGSAVVERASGRVVGAAALRLGNDADAEIGYWVAPDARGHGYAAEATRVLAVFAHEHGVPRVHLDCDVTNLASVRTALGAGFGYEGVARGAAVRRDGAALDVARFARVATDPATAIEPVFAPLPDGRLHDDVLELRVTAPEDAGAFVEIVNDELTRRYAFDDATLSLAESTRRCARAGLEWLVGARAQLSMVDLASGRFAGECQIRLTAALRMGGIGYAVHPDFRGRGFTGRALHLLADWAFDSLDLARLELGAKTDNIASQRAAVAGGFEAEGVMHRRLPNADGTMADEAIFARINPRVPS